MPSGLTEVTEKVTGLGMITPDLDSARQTARQPHQGRGD